MTSSVLLLAWCGLPGTGKSTLSRALVDHLRSTQQGVALHVEYDGFLRETLAEDEKDFSPEKWSASRARARAAVLAALTSLRAETTPSAEKPSPSFIRVVIADDVCEYKSMRKQLRALAREAGAVLVVAHVVADADLAARRNAEREPGLRVSDASFQNIVERFEAPTEKECDLLIRLEASEEPVASVGRLARRLREPAPAPKAAPKERAPAAPQPLSEKAQAELDRRKAVGERIRAARAAAASGLEN